MTFPPGTDNDFCSIDELLAALPQLGLPHFQRGQVWGESAVALITAATCAVKRGSTAAADAPSGRADRNASWAARATARRPAWSSATAALRAMAAAMTFTPLAAW